MHDSAVGKFSVRDQVKAHLPQPSGKGQREKDQDHGPDGIVPEIILTGDPFPFFMLRDGVQPGGIYQPFRRLFVVFQLEAETLLLLQYLDRFVPPERDSEHICQNSLNASQLRGLRQFSAVLLIHIGISKFQHQRIRIFK